MPIVNPSGSPIVPATLAMVTVSLYSDVRALIAGQASMVHVLGGSAVGDGQDGIFYWNSTSTAADDGFATLAPNLGGTGRWIRLYSSFSLSTGAAHVGFNQSGTLQTIGTAAGKFSEIVSVRDQPYGADPSKTAAQNTTAFNAALAANSVVFVPGNPSDVYDLNALTTLTAGKILYGKATLRFNTTGDGIAFNIASPAQNKVARIEGLSFTNSANVPSSFIKNTGILNLVIDGCRFSGCTVTYCIDNQNGYGTKIKDCVFSDVVGGGVIGRDNGGSTTYSYVLTIDGCDFTRISGKGIEMEGTWGLKVSNTVIESCTGIGIDVGTQGSASITGLNISFDNVHFESNTTDDVNLRSSGATFSCNAVFTGCSFITGAGCTVRINDASEAIFINCKAKAGVLVTVIGSASAKCYFLGTSIGLTQSGTYTFQRIERLTGSWTPVLTADTPGNLNVVCSTQVGSYTLSGDTLTAWFRITTSTFTQTTASGNWKITGLPFSTVSTPSGFVQSGSGGLWQGITKANYTQWAPYVIEGTNVINFGGSGSGQALATLAVADMPSGGTVYLDFTLTMKVVP